MARRSILTALLVAGAALLPSASPATFHHMKIREIFPGTGGDPNARYIMLQMFTGGQTQTMGHAVTVYDAAGAVVGTFMFTGNLGNGTNQATVLLATTEAETFFGVTADLVITPVLAAAGGKVCFEDIDCVSWGPFGGNSNNPSASGTPFSPLAGLLTGHAARRDISSGNPTMLEEDDDTDDSFADFDCVPTAEPKNNAGAMGAYTDPAPCPMCGNNMLDFGEQCDGTADAACPGGCQVDCRCAAHDAVVLPVRAVKVKVKDDPPMAVTKTIKVKVRNADVGEAGIDAIALMATSDCPAGVTIGMPNFDGDNVVNLEAGKTDTAELAVTVTDAAFTTFNEKALKRCTMTFTAATQAPGNLDPTTTNNSVTAELNVVDENDAEMPSPPNHESYSVSAKPLKVTIGKDDATVAKTVKPAVGNADILPAPDVGDAISLMVDVSMCSGVSVAVLDMDRDAVGNQASVAVNGGKTAKGALTLSFSAAMISTPNSKAPTRCTATLTAVGPSGLADPDPTNNATRLVIDIVDKNDL